MKNILDLALEDNKAIEETVSPITMEELNESLDAQADLLALEEQTGTIFNILDRTEDQIVSLEANISNLSKIQDVDNNVVDLITRQHMVTMESFKQGTLVLGLEQSELIPAITLEEKGLIAKMIDGIKRVIRKMVDYFKKTIVKAAVYLNNAEKHAKLLKVKLDGVKEITIKDYSPSLTKGISTKFALAILTTGLNADYFKNLHQSSYHANGVDQILEYSLKTQEELHDLAVKAQEEYAARKEKTKDVIDVDVEDAQYPMVAYEKVQGEATTIIEENEKETAKRFSSLSFSYKGIVVEKSLSTEKDMMNSVLNPIIGDLIGRGFKDKVTLSAKTTVETFVPMRFDGRTIPMLVNYKFDWVSVEKNANVLDKLGAKSFNDGYNKVTSFRKVNIKLNSKVLDNAKIKPISLSDLQYANEVCLDLCKDMKNFAGERSKDMDESTKMLNDFEKTLEIKTNRDQGYSRAYTKNIILRSNLLLTSVFGYIATVNNLNWLAKSVLKENK